MPHRLPPLTSLRAFEAAGRHLSFTLAAAELRVTQAAISHQVKSLETHLGKALFLRQPRALELTLAGKALLPVVRSAFDEISHTVAELTDSKAGSAITVRLAPSFAAKWLSPRLEDFRRKHPRVDLSLRHSNEPADFARQAIDLAITYGKGDWPGVIADKLLSIDFFPVCAPSHMRGEHALTDVRNLRYHTLLHDADFQNWTDWLRLAGVTDIDPRRGTVMDDTNVLTQAAVNGLGIALGSTPFVADHLEAGRLVRPFASTLRSDFAYYVVCPKQNLQRSSVRAFKEWLMQQKDKVS
ncbi:MAG: transcriptional regulator GcvA [Gammaproteobacteria bacterium]|nr:transcriptional regulator GcvA [Gammaproteobacteria bacterium]MDH5302597.1 transcriptional regulator GcvA [Gammaproteobacteria bacterium]MDH5323077.1 transcriptional regulator GcvA [Gammaproteobacteria bacterium]